MKKTLLGLNAEEWGAIALLANGVSVVVQVSTLLKTRDAQSFSMSFIYTMLVLNAWYCFVAYLQENLGFAIATLSFVVYNCMVVYFYHYGRGSAVKNEKDT